MWNPLRTLAGRLVLVTIVAILLSHAVAIALFANERGRTLRRVAEQAVAERVAFTAERLRAAQPRERHALAENLRDYGIRYQLTTAPAVDRTEGIIAQRVARLVSDALRGAEVRAVTRVVERERPRQWRRRFEDDGRPFEAPAPPPDDGEVIVVSPPEPGMGAGRDVMVFREERMNDAGPRLRATQITLAIALGENQWLSAQARLPAPRPLPLNIFFAAFASIIAVGVGAALISRQIGRPLADLANAADRLGVGDTNVAVGTRGPDDVKRASEAFNAMAARLGRQMARQRQMLWALSHDLRTPITALRLRAELVEDEALKQRILSPLAEMETLTEQALSLARAGASEEARETIDLAEVARTLCAELSELGIRITAETTAPVRVSCRPNEIARALRNLAENADKYGGGGVMRVTQANGEAIVEVRDNGPGLSEEDLKRVTQPFFRADEARSFEGGAGLGLAIVQAIADGHGGRLMLENRSPGLSAKLVLPKREA